MLLVTAPIDWMLAAGVPPAAPCWAGQPCCWTSAGSSLPPITALTPLPPAACAAAAAPAVPFSAKPPWTYLGLWGPTATAAAPAWPTLTLPGHPNPRPLHQQACPRRPRSQRVEAPQTPAVAPPTPVHRLQSRQSTACSTWPQHRCRHP